MACIPVSVRLLQIYNELKVILLYYSVHSYSLLSIISVSDLVQLCTKCVLNLKHLLWSGGSTILVFMDLYKLQ